MQGFDKMIGNPMFHMGLGLLGSGGNAQGALSGLQSYQAQQQAQLMNQYRQAQMAQMVAEKEQEEKGRKALEEAGINPYLPPSIQAHQYKLDNPMPNQGPASLQEWQAFSQMSPVEQEAYLTMKRANTFLNMGNMWGRGFQTVPGYQPVAPINPPPEQTPEFKGAQVAAQERSRAAVGKETAQGQRQTTAEIQAAKTTMLDDLINDAKNKAGFWTTGFMGSITQYVPGSPGYDLGKNLDTIKANIGFDRLQQMRDNSPTGGALGQVSERENVLLQAVWGALEQSQSETQFKANLERVRKQVQQSWNRVARAYQKDYGEPLDLSFLEGNGSSSASNYSEMSDEELLRALQQ